MKQGRLRSRLAQLSGYLAFGLLTLLLANVTSSFIIAIIHAGALFYRSGPPSPEVQHFLNETIRLVTVSAPMVHWTLVFICAALLRYQTKSPSALNFFAFVFGAWLAVLPFTLLPEHSDEQALVPQLGRFLITSLPMLAGIFLGVQLRQRAEQNARTKWLIREADSPQKLVDALKQRKEGSALHVALYTLTDALELKLSASANSETIFPKYLQLREEVNWPNFERDESLLFKTSLTGHASFPSPTWWYLLRHEAAPSSVLIFAPQRKPIVNRDPQRFQDLAEQARLSLWQQELVRHAQLNARDGERRRVSYEIHDRLAQDLISGLLQLEAARSHLGSMKTNVENALAAVEATLRRALDEARKLAWKFHDATLDFPVLHQALQNELTQFAEKHDISAQFAAVGDEYSENTDNHPVLLAALREALSNIAKHAMARQVRVTLSYINGSVALDVCDNGHGLSRSPLRAIIGDGGFGLTALRQRVERAGGQLVVEDGPSGGTSFSVQFPGRFRETA